MSFPRGILAAFIGGVLAIVFVLAWRASKETGKSIPGSLTDIPNEAQRLASDVRSKATGAVNTGWETIRDKETAIRDRLASAIATGTGNGPEASSAPESPPAFEAPQQG